MGNYNNSGILKGQKWNDISGNGIEEPDDNPLPGWFINVNNTTLGNHTLLTDGVGEWQVLVPFGTYEVSEVLYPNFRQTYPSSGTYTIELNDSVFTGQNYGIEFINFGNQEIPQIGNISGLKYNDFNHNGVYDPVWDIDPDDEELGISGWNISLYYQNGTYTGISQLTNNGSYYFAGLDANQIYYVEEESKPDWYNSTPTRLMVDFKNTTEYPNESLVDSGIAIQVLPVQNVAFTTKSLWGINGSFHQDIEWSPFALKNSTRVSANPHWQNNTDYDFTIVYDPSTPLTAINYTVSGPLTQGFTTTTIKAPADINGSRANPMDTIDVFARASVIGENVTLEVTNLKLTVGSDTFTITNNSVALSNTLQTQTHLLIRANRLTGGNITQGFTLTGKQKFIYPASAVPAIDGEGYSVSIRAGKDNLTPIDVIEQFGNYRHTGEIEGTKFSDNNGNGVWDVALGEEPLDNWTFQCYYENGTLARERLSGIPDPGVWEFYLPYGNYTIKEVNQSGYRPTLRAGGVNITIDDVQNHWMNIDFGNQPLGSISGYKVDNNGNPLANWNISISNTTYPYFNSTLTDGNGAFNFTDVPIGVYWLNETLKDGWTQITPNRTVEINITTRDIFNQNFTNQRQTGYISGFKLYPNLTGIPGWNITLYNQTGGDVLFDSQLTGSDGSYNFTGLPYGVTFNVSEVIQPGWTPIGATYHNNLAIDGSLSYMNRNFTNERQTGISAGSNSIRT